MLSNTMLHGPAKGSNLTTEYHDKGPLTSMATRAFCLPRSPRLFRLPMQSGGAHVRVDIFILRSRKVFY